MTTKRLNAWLSRDEVQRILGSVDTTSDIGRRDAVVLRLGFTVGLRRQEIVDARWGDLKWPDQLKLVGKGGKAAVVAITRSTLLAIESWEAILPEGASGTYRPLVSSFRSNGWEGRTVQPTGKPLSTNSIREITLKYSGATGIAFAPHDMRRTFAGLLYEQTNSIETVSAALRHSNVGTTQRYLETRQDAAFQAVQKAGFDI